MAEDTTATEQTTPPSGDDVLVEGGAVETTPPTLDALLSDVQGDDAKGLDRFKGKPVGDLWKAYRGLEAKLGERPTPLPGADADAAAWQAYYKQLPGYPEAPDQYTVAAPELPEGAPPMSAEQYSGFLAIAHQAGLTNAQVAPLVHWYEQTVAQQWETLQAGQEAHVAAGYDTLKAAWGANTDRNITIAAEGLRRTFGDDLGFLDQLVQAKDGAPVMLKNIPQFVRLAHDWAVMKGHDKFVPGAPGGPSSVQDARDRIAAARKDAREGKITDDEFAAVQRRYGPIAYGQGSGDGIDEHIGTLTAADVAVEP